MSADYGVIRTPDGYAVIHEPSGRRVGVETYGTWEEARAAADDIDHLDFKAFCDASRYDQWGRVAASCTRELGHPDDGHVDSHAGRVWR